MKRWLALDKALGSFDGLDVDQFAKWHKVSEKTILRDLKDLEELGNCAIHEREPEGNYVWRYDEGVDYLFVKSVSAGMRRAVEQFAKLPPSEKTKWIAKGEKQRGGTSL